jgi:hypothetical protein
MSMIFTRGKNLLPLFTDEGGSDVQEPNCDVPEGYFVVKSPSYRVWVFMRMSVVDGLEAAYKNVSDNMKIYPLSQVDNPPALELISASGKSFNTALLHGSIIWLSLPLPIIQVKQRARTRDV